MLSFELARRLGAQKIAVNCAWPGIVNTEGMRGLGGNMKWFSILMRPLMRSPAAGARTPLWLATSPEVDGVTGKVFGTMFGEGKKELTMPPMVADPANAAKLYEICEKLCAS
jgi:NAD(P)-dependent dehydrogenase (short-subunit alcohol dehydrogenase family)